jgi:NAD(P)-dependent dehydrogenase (short-subunit alcohol dehydrogenase family)
MEVRTMPSSVPEAEPQHPPVALVTGGARGIGLGISRALGAEGYAIAIAGRRAEQEAKEGIGLVSRHAPAVSYYRADVAAADDRAQLLAGIRRDYGRLDVLVNNAGVAPPERVDLLSSSEEGFDRLMSINLKGPHFLTRAVAVWMIEQAEVVTDVGGCIINITSVSADTVSTSRGDYCISKAGLSMSSALWAVRLAEHGIRVYEVRPGIVRTDMTAGVEEKYDRLIADGLLLEPRWGEPEDVGRAVAALARGDFPYATGSVITLDGGMSIRRL